MNETAIETSTRYNEELYEEVWRLMSFRSPDHLPWWPALKAICENTRDRLEIGPGIFPRLPVEGTHVMDLSKYALEVLAKHGAIPHYGLVAEQGFADASFDVVGMFELLEHVSDDTGLLRDIARITRPGGYLALTVPLGMNTFARLTDSSAMCADSSRTSSDQKSKQPAMSSCVLRCTRSRRASRRPVSMSS